MSYALFSGEKYYLTTQKRGSDWAPSPSDIRWLCKFKMTNTLSHCRKCSRIPPSYIVRGRGRGILQCNTVRKLSWQKQSAIYSPIFSLTDIWKRLGWTEDVAFKLLILKNNNEPAYFCIYMKWRDFKRYRKLGSCYFHKLYNCSETTLTGESRLLIRTPLGFWTRVPHDRKQTGSPLD